MECGQTHITKWTTGLFFELRGRLHGTSFHIKQTLLLWFDLSVTWQQCAGTSETANVWNRVPEFNLLKPQLSFRLCKLASGVPVNTVTTLMLMLMLVQVSAFCCSHYQTLIKHSTVHRKQVEYDDICWGEFECLWHNFRSQTMAEFL